MLMVYNAQHHTMLNKSCLLGVLRRQSHRHSAATLPSV